MKPTILALLLCAPLITFGGRSGRAQDIKIIKGVTLIDGTAWPPIENAVIVIDGGRIKQVLTASEYSGVKGAEIIDAPGKFVIPGLADMHNHLSSGGFLRPDSNPDFKANLRALLGWGFTMIFDPGIGDMNAFQDLKRAAAEDPAYPHFYCVGRFLTIKDGHGSAEGAFTPDTPEEARGIVRQLKAAGVDAVKFMDEDFSYVTKRPVPRIKPEIIAAIIDEAHKQGLKAYVHAPVLEYAKESLRMGADGLMHGIISAPVDAELISLMKRNRAVYVSTCAIFEAGTNIGGWARREETLDVRGFYPKATFEVGEDPENVKKWESRWDNFNFFKEHMAVLRANLKKVFDSGIPVVMGSDTSGGGMGTLLGLASQAELTLLVESGLSPREALQTATVNAARMVGMDKEQGTIEPGKLADLLILDADPLADISNITRIYRVVKGGVVYDPAALRTTAAR